jgi:CubicO group peptidase (beta-lactamase class C family)
MHSMAHKGKLLVTLMLTASLLSGCSGSGGGTKVEPILPPIAETLTETLDNYLTANQLLNAPGLSIHVKKDGAVVYNAARGLANSHPELSISEVTGFRLASVTKSFTALVVMQLADQGLLSVDDKLLSHIPELSSAYRDITLHHLLTHQSGIPDYLQANIFMPLGMHNSYVANEFHQVGEFGENTALNNANTSDVLGFNSLIYGSAGIVSSIEDMSIFINAWLNNMLVPQDTKALMLQSHSFIPGIGDYGYGWITDRGLHSYDTSDYWHTGGYDYYQTLLYFSPDHNLQVVALSNGGAVNRGRIENMTRLTRSFYSL